MIGKKGILRFFYKVTMVCYKKLHLWRIPIPGRDKVQADLNRMHPGENPQERVTDYYVTKLTLSAVILIAGIMLAITMHYSSRESHVLQNQWVYRGSGEEGSREYSITGQVEDGERYSFQMEVMPRKYSQSELENLYEQFGRELPQLILALSCGVSFLFTTVTLTVVSLTNSPYCISALNNTGAKANWRICTSSLGENCLS